MERLGVRALSRGAAAVALAVAVGVVAPDLHAQGAPPTSTPSAADLARARAHFAQGEAAAAAGRWAEAIERFEKVRSIKETPGVVFHLAAAHEGAGHLALALTLFEHARSLAAAGDAADVITLADGRIAALGHRVPRLVVRVPAPAESGEVRLDGAPLPEARWGEPVRLDPGPHRIEAAFRGEPFVRELELGEGTWITVVVGDPGAPTSAPAPAPPPAAPPTSTLPATGLTAEPSSPPDDGPPWGPIALGAGGLALVAGGVVTFVVAGSESSSAAEACAAGSCDPGARDVVRALDVTSLGLWIAGGAAIAGAAVWWTLDDGAGPTVEARITPGRASLVGRF